MAKLPIISGKQAVKAFSRLGYKVTCQTGSHIRMWHFYDKNKRPLTIPDHKY
jgi:predicted RNA binding protein YcfA (HicA-like mRNA interferase family)